MEGLTAFTGHVVLAVGDHMDDHALAALDPHGFGGAHHPRVVTALAGPDGWVDSLDDVRVMSDAADTGLVALGTGLGGLAEISIEVTRRVRRAAAAGRPTWPVDPRRTVGGQAIRGIGRARAGTRLSTGTVA